MNNVQVYVVSLEKDIHRRKHLEEQFKDNYSQMNIVEAIDGRDFKPEKVKEYSQNYTKQYHKEMSPGEVGCVLSHIKALEQFIDSNEEYALIIEDDILGSDDDLDKLNNLNLSAIDDNAVIICWAQNISARAKYVVGKKLLDEPSLMSIPKVLYSNIIGACCYVVTQESAKIIVNAHKECLRLADQWGEILKKDSTQMYFIDLFQHPKVFSDSNLSDSRTYISKNKKRKVFLSIYNEIQRVIRRIIVQYYKLIGYKNILN